MTTDKQLIEERFGSGFRTYDRLAIVQQQICDELAQLCRDIIQPKPSRVLEIGIGTGFLTKPLVGLYPSAEFMLNDISNRAAAFVDRYIAGIDSRYLWGDAENIDLPDEMELVASASTVQWFDDLPRFLDKIYSATAVGGHIAITTFGPENFREITALTREGLNYHTPKQIENMVSATGFRLLHLSDYTRTLPFASPLDVLHHIKATGVNSISKRGWSRGHLADFERRYSELFSLPDGLVSLTYHPIFVVAQR